MELNKKAVFSLEKFKFSKFSFDDSHIKPEGKGQFRLDTSGTFYPSESIYKLEFIFDAFDSDFPDEPFISVNLQADFTFVDEVKTLEEIPEYFYTNSIAILYPYLRSFISSLTVQANEHPIILPAMNLSKLGDPLKEKTQIVE